MLLTIYSVIVFIYWAFLTIYLLVNGRKISYLSSIQTFAHDPAPPVVIIIAVRNEEYALKEALTSVCNLDYPNYTVMLYTSAPGLPLKNICFLLMQMFCTIKMF